MGKPVEQPIENIKNLEYSNYMKKQVFLYYILLSLILGSINWSLSQISYWFPSLNIHEYLSDKIIPLVSISFCLILGIINPKWFWLGGLAMLIPCIFIDIFTLLTSIELGYENDFGPFGWFLGLIFNILFTGIGALIGTGIRTIIKGMRQ